MKDNLLVCPRCRREVRWIDNRTKEVTYPLVKTVLGEMKEGDVVINRNGLHVIVSGNDLKVSCGNCGEMVFFRKGGPSEVRSNGVKRIHRFTLIQETIQLGTYSAADYTGSSIRATSSNGTA